MENYLDELEKSSINLIVYDGVMIANLLTKTKNGNTALSLFPYLAFYLRASQEFFDISLIDQEIEKKIKDIRNGLKTFTGRYSKGKKVSDKVDNLQNETFKQMLRFKFLEKFNIHYNLGISFTENNRIVFNTQLSNHFLELSGIELLNHSDIFKFSTKLGRILADFLQDYLNINNLELKKFQFGKEPITGYIDYNTNKMSDVFQLSLDKENNLVLLHLASMIGFVNNILLQICNPDNLWSFRILYINVHNISQTLNKFILHIEQNKDVNIDLNELKDTLFQGNQLLSSDFRGCMMHYKFVNKGVPIIKKEKFDKDLPFYGLVESCFNEKNYEIYYAELIAYSKKLENLLNSFFKINFNKINWASNN